MMESRIVVRPFTGIGYHPQPVVQGLLRALDGTISLVPCRWAKYLDLLVEGRPADSTYDYEYLRKTHP